MRGSLGSRKMERTRVWNLGIKKLEKKNGELVGWKEGARNKAEKPHIFLVLLKSFCEHREKERDKGL